MKTLLAVITLVAASNSARASQESLVELLPARARMAVVVRKNAIAAVRDLLFRDVEMMRELGPYLERSLGIDPTRVEGIVGFTFGAGDGEPKAAIILRIPGTAAGPLKLPKAGDAFGTPLYRIERNIVCARLKAGIVAGNEAEVRAVVAAERGREPKLSRDAGLGKLLDAEHDDIDVALAFGRDAIPPLTSMGVDDLLVVYRHGVIEGRLRGDPGKLAPLQQMALGGMQMALAQLDQERLKQTATNDPAKGASAIVLYHQAKRVFAELQPKLEGNALTVQYKLPDAQVLGASTGGLVVVGVLAAVAIPAYIKYIRLAKAAEASVQLGRLAEAIRMLKLIDRKGKVRATEWTPRTGCCGQKGDRCAPDPKAWQGPPWSTLGFTIDEPHYFQYRVQVDASGAAPRYTVEARADLDCNGKFSSYRRSITGDEAPGPLESENETE
jgi:hypothetical protein